MRKTIGLAAWAGLSMMMGAEARAEGCLAQDGRPRLSGEFAFSGQVTLLSAIDSLAVEGFSDEGRERVRLLRSRGYLCSRATDRFYRCIKHLRDTALPAGVRTRVVAEAARERVSLTGEASGVERLNESPLVREWKIVQPVRVNERAADRWIYLDSGISTRVSKLVLEGDPRDELLIRSCELLGRVIEKREGSVSYLVEAGLTLGEG